MSPRKIAYSPDGFKIIGTLDEVEVVVFGTVYEPDGIDEAPVDYTGQTKVDWESQVTQRNIDGHRNFVDANHGIWPESELIFKEEDHA